MGISDPLKSISAYYFKHSPIQMPFSSYSNFIVFVEGKRERNYKFC
jgi:myo-inositol-1-phosphate synthase